MKTPILVVLYLFFAIGVARSQDCNANETIDWQSVEIRIMEIKQAEPAGSKVTGESTVKVKKAIKAIEDLSANEKEEIQKTAAKYGSCLVFIDTKGLWDSANFPTMASQNLLYYYWVKKD